MATGQGGMEAIHTMKHRSRSSSRSEAAKRAGSRLHSYMAFRAKREGMEYALSEAFFAHAFLRDFRLFFGVHVSESGDLLSDEQNPDAFEAFSGGAGRKH
jgi:hypothetical protein